jgi:hypothetical protein
MTTTLAPGLGPGDPTTEGAPTVGRDPAGTTRRAPNARSFGWTVWARRSVAPQTDATQRRRIGYDPYDDPTQGRQIGSEPYDDPSQGLQLGSDPYDDPTQGRQIGRPSRR